MTDLADPIEQNVSRSPMREAWHMFRKNIPAMFGLILMIAILGMTLYGTLLFQGDPYEIGWAPHEPPGMTPEFPLGTDYLGRDIVAGLLSGGGPTLQLAHLPRQLRWSLACFSERRLVISAAGSITC